MAKKNSTAKDTELVTSRFLGKVDSVYLEVKLFHFVIGLVLVSFGLFVARLFAFVFHGSGRPEHH